jgi:hypothetical protein
MRHITALVIVIGVIECVVLLAFVFLVVTYRGRDGDLCFYDGSCNPGLLCRMSNAADSMVVRVMHPGVCEPSSAILPL